MGSHGSTPGGRFARYRAGFGPLAHPEEQGTFNPKVPGSRPGRPTRSSIGPSEVVVSEVNPHDASIARTPVPTIGVTLLLEVVGTGVDPVTSRFSGWIVTEFVRCVRLPSSRGASRDDVRNDLKKKKSPTNLSFGMEDSGGLHATGEPRRTRGNDHGDEQNRRNAQRDADVRNHR